MRQPFFLLIFILIAAATAAYAQGHKGKGRISGYVYDQDGRPLQDVEISLFSLRAHSGFRTATDAEGHWIASWVCGGRWNIDFEKTGYKPKRISLDVNPAQGEQDLEIRLEKTEGFAFPDEALKRYEEGKQLYRQNKFEQALEIYRSIAADHPGAHFVHKDIGHCFFRMEDYDKARRHYQMFLDREPEDIHMKLAIGNCYSNQGNEDEALKWYNTVDIENIDDATVLYNIGTHFYNMSQFPDALRYYRKAVGIKSDFTDAIYQIGLTYLNLKKNAEALNAFEEYLRHDPDSERAAAVKRFMEYLKKETGGNGED